MHANRSTAHESSFGNESAGLGLRQLRLEALIALAARAIFGVFVSLILALIGQLAIWAAWSVFSVGWSLDEFVALIVMAIGVGAALGATLGWLKLDRGVRWVKGICLLALFGGLAGAWLGFAYGRATYGNVPFSHDTNIATLLGAGVGANLLPFSASLLLCRRTRRFVKKTTRIIDE